MNVSRQRFTEWTDDHHVSEWIKNINGKELGSWKPCILDEKCGTYIFCGIYYTVHNPIIHLYCSATTDTVTRRKPQICEISQEWTFWPKVKNEKMKNLPRVAQIWGPLLDITSRHSEWWIQCANLAMAAPEDGRTLTAVSVFVYNFLVKSHIVNFLIRPCYPTPTRMYVQSLWPTFLLH